MYRKRIKSYMRTSYKKFVYLFLIILLFSCGGTNYHKTPIDDLIKNFHEVDNYSIILHDMDIEGSFFKKYKHQYKVIIQKGGSSFLSNNVLSSSEDYDRKKAIYDTIRKNDSLKISQVDQSNFTDSLTQWHEVSEDFFESHVNDMGMEIVSKTNGKVVRQVSPPGYSRYVGNPQYGEWRRDGSGNSFWSFYGKYAFISSMFGMYGGPIYRRSYYDYRGSYYGKKPYYGTKTSSGSRQYGTFSSSAKKSNPSFHRRLSSNSSFKNKVNSKVSRSNSRYRTGSRSYRSRSFSSYGK